MSRTERVEDEECPLRALVWSTEDVVVKGGALDPWADVVASGTGALSSKVELTVPEEYGEMVSVEA